MIEAGTSQADAAGLPCYLETATEQNIAFYTKRGFEVTAEAQLSPEFKGWAMVRQPR